LYAIAARIAVRVKYAARHTHAVSWSIYRNSKHWHSKSVITFLKMHIFSQIFFCFEALNVAKNIISITLTFDKKSVCNRRLFVIADIAKTPISIKTIS
jgi:hypothetical protein